MQKIQMKILGISAGNVTSSYTLILEEVKGERKLPIVIGVLEAQAIAIQIEKIKPIRPMTHDLFKSFASSFKIRVKEVIIHKLHEGIFYALIIASNGDVIKEIDSRSSDAIALALRFNAPVYTYEDILNEAGITLKSFHISDIKEGDENEDDALVKEDDSQEKESKTPSSMKIEDLEKLSVLKLKKMLDGAITSEDYIFAARIRDAIKKKEKKE
jgi:uncharacterized protein